MARDSRAYTSGHLDEQLQPARCHFEYAYSPVFGGFQFTTCDWLLLLYQTLGSTLRQSNLPQRAIFPLSYFIFAD